MNIQQTNYTVPHWGAWLSEHNGSFLGRWIARYLLARGRIQERIARKN